MNRCGVASGRGAAYRGFRGDAAQTDQAQASNAGPKTPAGCGQTNGTARGLALLLLLALPVAGRAQYGCVTNSGAITITGYTGPGGAVTVPATIDGLPVTGIGVSAFYRNDGITRVMLPASVTTIGDNAFHGCTGLTNVTMADRDNT